MQDKPETQFNHSIRVPRLYKTAAKIVEQVKEEGASIKHLIYEQKKHPNVQALLSLVAGTLQHGSQLDYLLRTSQILIKEPRFDPWLARILITELFWGKQRLTSEAKPLQTILKYQDELSSIFNKLNASEDSTSLFRKVTKPRYVRINTIVLSVENAINGFQDEGWVYTENFYDCYTEYLLAINNLQKDQFTLDFHLKDVLVFPPGTHFYTHPCYVDGSIILQDKASCVPAMLLNPSENSVVLDMCAAPGMKTTQLASIMNNKGKVYAVERDQRRFESLKKQVGVSNASCVEAINRDVLTMTDKEFPNVEYILVDPSCSGSGMLDRLNFIDPSEKCEPSRLEKLAGFQIMILRHALKNFPKVKRVVYSTCSIYAQENEEVIEQVFKHCWRHFKLINAKEALNNQWENVGDVEKYPEVGGKCLYAKPDVDLTNGFFVAVFERLNEEEILELKEKLKEEEKVRQNQEEVIEANGNESETNPLNEVKYITEDVTTTKKKKKHSAHLKENLEEIKVIDNVEYVEDLPVKIKRKKKKHSENPPENLEKSEVIEEVGCVEELQEKSKRKKKKHSENTSDNLIKVDERANVERVEELPEKTKRKKKTHSENTSDNLETVEVVEGTEEVPVKRKKKHSKEKLHEQEEPEINILVESENIINESKIKKKKKYAEENLNDYENIEQVIEYKPEITQKRKHSKKKHHEQAELVLPVVEEIIESDVKQKKKSKKNSELQTNLALEHSGPDEIEPPIKKKKKDSKNRTAEEWIQ